ncbi:hypothetical protein [Paenibacillus periandrae]|uniref:hypothetical protein n=1 Tax=Paenibacillus periandrae TaxID=1761741 RepID=UPI001F0963E1|nr:hypothetical protein [Paenibacillus periandrae]
MFDKLEWFFFGSAIGKLISVLLFSLTGAWFLLTVVWMVFGVVEGFDFLFSFPCISACIALLVLTEAVTILLLIKIAREYL